MTVAVVLFTADLRLHDHPPLRAALASSDEVVPLFVRDSAIEAAGFGAPNRLAFLADCLRDLDAGLRERGGRLVVRSGDVVEEVGRIVAETGAADVHLAAGVSAYARRREERLRAALESGGQRLHVHDGVITAVVPGAVTPAASDHFAVFTPYFRRWSAERVQDAFAAPRAVRVPDGPESEAVPARGEVTGVSEGLAEGGEQQGRTRLAAWLRRGLAAYEERHDDLSGDGTSRLSPHLHFGTLSPVELVHRARTAKGPGPRPSSGSCAGASSITRSSRPGRTRPGRTTAPGTTTGGPRRTPPTTSRPGDGGAPATPWSTRRCASCATRAGCTTVDGCSPRAS